MDPALKNLRDWVLLLMALFCVLDIAGLQYAIALAQTASDQPNLAGGQVVRMFHGPKGALYPLYVTSRQITVLYGFLGSAALSLMGALGLIIANGMREALKSRAISRRRRK